MRLAAPIFLLFLLICFPVIAMSGGDNGNTASQLAFSHTPVYSTPAGIPIFIMVTLSTPAEMQEIRLYFKAIRSTHYVYIPFRKTGKLEYAADIPPLRNGVGGLDYIILFVSPATAPIKTKEYRILVTDNYTPPKNGEQSRRVFAESAAPLPHPKEFYPPLEIVPSKAPLFAQAIPFSHEPIKVPGKGGANAHGIGGLGGVSVNIAVGGVGINYRSSN